MHSNKSKESIYRTISTKFWSDTKVQECMSPEDRYMFLYLLTNDNTQLVGCYEIAYKKIAFETGYDLQACKNIMDRLSKLGIVEYDDDTSEILIVNWAINNWTNSPTYKKGVASRFPFIKSEKFKEFVRKQFKSIYMEDLS